MYLPGKLLGLLAAAAPALGVFWVRIVARRRLSWSSPGAKSLLPVGVEPGGEPFTSRFVPVSAKALVGVLKRVGRLPLGELSPKFVSFLDLSGRL